MNTLKVAKDLQAAGCDSKVAEAISSSISEAIDSKAVTKEDLLKLELTVTERLSGFERSYLRWQIGLLIFIGGAFVGQTIFIIDSIKTLLGK